MVKGGIFLGERYEVLSKIGTGGMADVYKGKDHMLNRLVAIKVLKKEYREDEVFVKKFRSEAQAAAGLMHPNIVNVYDVGEERGLYYMVMELVEGITLKTYIEKKGSLPAKEVVSIAIQMCAGIEAAHSHHIIHRDIKPQNIMISKEGKVKVTDFGIARAASSHTVSSNAMGSVHYTSPEQARGGVSDEKSDIYSVGITLYEMATGELPFDGDSTVSIAIKHLQEDITPPSEYTELPYSLEQIILKCTMKNPEKRYASIPDLVKDLKRSLVDPEGNFVLLDMYPRMEDTIMMTSDELSKIQEKYEPHEDDEEDDDFDDDEYDDFEDEDYEDGKRGKKGKDGKVNPRMNKVMKILTIVVAVIIVFVLLFVIGQATGLLKFGQGITANNEEKVKVPDIVGQDEEGAKAKIIEKGLKFQVVERKPSTKYEEGIVIEQKTEAGKKVAKDTMIKVVVSSGLKGEEITVPDVSGMNEDDARKALINAGFSSDLITTSYEFSEDVDSGSTIGTDPAAEAKATAEATITIRVSKGQKKPDKVEVPYIIGKSESEAKSLISSVGLNVSGTSSEYSSSVGEGYIISQSISSGSKVDAGSSLSYVVSKGPEPAKKTPVPDLAGKTVEQARQALSNVGLKYTEVAVDSSEAYGIVVSTNPSGGSSVDAGSTVTIMYSNASQSGSGSGE